MGVFPRVAPPCSLLKARVGARRRPIFITLRGLTKAMVIRTFANNRNTKWDDREAVLFLSLSESQSSVYDKFRTTGADANAFRSRIVDDDDEPANR